MCVCVDVSVSYPHRRQVDNGTCPGYESSFSLTLSPTSTATLTTSNCSEIDGSEVWTEDACIDSLQLSFSPGECETSVSVWLRQDLVLEGPETLLLYITDCSNCVSNISQSQPMGIVIDDTHDCEFLSLSLSLSLSHTHTHTHFLPLSLSLTHTFSLSLSLSLSHTLSPSLSLSCTFSHTIILFFCLYNRVHYILHVTILTLQFIERTHSMHV